MTPRCLKYLPIFALLNAGAFIFGVMHFWLDSHDPVQIEEVSLPAGARSLMGSDCDCDKSGSSAETNHHFGDQDKPPSMKSEFKVPNIVHYVWFNTEHSPINFHHMLSILSAHKFINPDVIYFHCDNEPIGEYWEQVKKLPSLKILHRNPPLKLFGEDVKTPFYYTSHSNVDRIKILTEYGGIYLDFDMWIIRSFDDLRRHSCVVGLEYDFHVCGSVVVCEKTSPFLLLWLNAYLDDYRIEEWAYNTGQVPTNLARRYPHLIHVEPNKLNRPNFKELDQLWGPNTFNWRENYGVHIWHRLWKSKSQYYQGVDLNAVSIKTMNTTIGQMARTIYYGSPDML